MPTIDTNPAGALRDVVEYGGDPLEVVWLNKAGIAISLVVNYEQGSELAIGDGDPTREPTKYGSRAGFWRLLDIFDETDVQCTFYACAIALERDRQAARQIRAQGHDVMSHASERRIDDPLPTATTPAGLLRFCHDGLTYSACGGPITR